MGKKSALVSGKIPKPTNFSNQRSNQYLSHTDTFTPVPPSTEPKKFFINLQDLIKIEEILNVLIEKVTQKESATEECENWWRITDENSIIKIDTLFKKPEVRQSLREAVILEAVGVTIVEFLDHSALGNEKTRNALISMLDTIHQNILVLIDIVLHRLPNSYSTNSWAVKLQTLTYQKRKVKCSKYENADLLLRQSQSIKEKIHEMAHEHTNPGAVLTKSVRSLLFLIIQVVREIESFDVLSARDRLRNAIADELEPPILNTTESVDFEVDLPCVSSPFLPVLKGQTFTLVLDLDETLVHYFEVAGEGNFLVRPGCKLFLEEACKHYEVVIFTAALQDYADWVLDQLDPPGCISHRLYRQHAIPAGNYYIKDLSKIGRDLTKVIIVDNVAENFQLQPDNGILIRSWFDDPNDNALLELLPLLKGKLY
jgi:CTD small phosphatase-like protein 2